VRFARLLLPLLVIALVVGGCIKKYQVVPPPTDPVPAPTTLYEAWDQLNGLVTPARVTLLSHNPEAWAARWEMLANAQKSINASYFILEPDSFGLAFLGLLLDKARQGVKVRLLIDGRGTTALTLDRHERDFMQELAAAGDVEVLVYNPPTNNLMKSLVTIKAASVVASTHTKIVTVDGERAIIGGRNITGRYFTDHLDDAGAWEDADILIEGKRAVAAVQKVFDEEVATRGTGYIAPDRINRRERDNEMLLFRHAMELWMKAPGLHVDDARVLLDHDKAREQAAIELAEAASFRLETLPTPQERKHLEEHLRELVAFPRLRGQLPRVKRHGYAQPLQILSKPSSVGETYDSLNPGLAALIASAEDEIVIHSAYFILSEQLVQMFEGASKRGVRIVVLTNGPTTSDNSIAQALFAKYWYHAARRLPTMRLFVLNGSSSLHAKRLVVDDELSVVGTYNFDPLSHAFNSELVGVVWDKQFAALNKAEMLSRLLRDDVVEYRLAKSKHGDLVKIDGEPVVSFGPKDHVPHEHLAELDRLSSTLVSLEGAMEFESPK
jgi:putative cardiolipin synthase